MKNHKVAVVTVLLAVCAVWQLGAEETKPATEKTTKLVAYYFHGTARCPTCMKFESYTQELLKESYKDELKTGRIEWRVVNVDDKENTHFVKDYKLENKSIVLVEFEGDRPSRWKNLDKIWDVVGNKDDFKKYIRAEVAAYTKK